MGSENVRFGDISQNSGTELKEAGLRFFTVLYLPLHRQIHCFSNKISSVPFSYQHSAVFLVALRIFHLAFLSEKLFKQQTYSSYLYQNTRFLLLWCCADAVGTYCCVNNLFFPAAIAASLTILSESVTSLVSRDIWFLSLHRLERKGCS